MIVSIAKLLAACCAIAAPFLAGMLIPHLPHIAAALIVGVLGCTLGAGGLAVFCSLDVAEELAHQRRLTPGTKG